MNNKQEPHGRVVVFPFRKKWRVLISSQQVAGKSFNFSEEAYHYACTKYPDKDICVMETNGQVKFKKEALKKFDKELMFEINPVNDLPPE